MLCKLVLLALAVASSEPEPAAVPQTNDELETSPEPTADETDADPAPKSDEEIAADTEETEETKPESKAPAGKISGGSGDAVNKVEEESIKGLGEVGDDIKDEKENVDLDKINGGESAADNTDTAPATASNSTDTPATAGGNSTDTEISAKAEHADESAAASMATLFVATLVAFAF